LSKHAWQIRLALKPVRFAKIRPARERSGDRVILSQQIRFTITVPRYEDQE
jgi:hypothetical protein